jgi:hypothetical protein
MAPWVSFALAGQLAYPCRNPSQSFGDGGSAMLMAELTNKQLWAHKIASMPLRRMTLSSTSAGPVARFAPRSSCET